MRSGRLDVFVGHDGIGEGKKLAEIVSHLGGGRLALGWRARLAIVGRNRLAAGVERSTGDLLVGLCRERGLEARAASARGRLRLLEWLGRNCAWIGAGAAVAVEAAFWTALTVKGSLSWRVLLSQTGPKLWSDLQELAVVILFLAAVSFGPVAGALSLAAAPPLGDLPREDPARRHLVEIPAER